MKKLISLSFCIIALIVMLTVSSFASAENTGTLGEDISWSFDESSGKLTITGVGKTKSYDGVATPFDTNIINNKIKSVEISDGITGIGTGLFKDCNSLKEVSFPESLISIGMSAFENCINLAQADLPSQLETIGKNAFKNSGLTEVTVLRGISYGDGVYEACGELNVAHISNSLRYLPAYIFANSSLETVYGGKKLERIGKGAFRGCSDLFEIDCTNINTFDEDCFYGCKLNNVEIGNTDIWANKKFANGNSNPVSWAKYVLSEGRQVTDISVFSADKISAYAFFRMKGIKSITIGPNVKSLGKSCFEECYGVESIAVLNEKITGLSLSTFEGSFTNKFKTYVSTVPYDSVLKEFPESLENIKINIYSAAEAKTYPCLKGEEFDITYTQLKKGEHTHIFIPTVTDIKVRANCQENGTADMVCPICFETKSMSIPKTEHIKSRYTLVPSTVGADGSETYACSFCGEKDVTVIPQIADIKLFGENTVYGCDNPVIHIKDRTGKTLSVLDYTYKSYPDFDNHCTIVTFKGKYSGVVTKNFDVIPESIFAYVDMDSSSKEISVKPVYRSLPYEAKLHIYLEKGNEEKNEVAVLDVTPDIANGYVINNLEPHTHYKLTLVTSSGDKFSGSSSHKLHTDLSEDREPTSITEATCTKNGTIIYDCDFCNYQKKVIVPRLGHIPDENKVPSREVYPCTSYTLYTKCKRCKYTIATESVSAEKEHSFVAGTVTKGGLWCTGTKELVCSVCGEKTIDEVYHAVSGVSIPKETYAYTGSAIKPKVTVECFNYKSLDSSNYSVSYSNNVDAGTATITVTLRGNYSGKITKTFKISKSVPQVVVTLSEGPYYFMSEDPVTPKPVVKDKDGVVFVQNLHYKLTYSNNTMPGIAKVKITFIGNFSGSVEKTFKIAPDKVEKISAYDVKTTSAGISWTISDNASYYRLQQSTDGKSWKTVVTTSDTNYTVKGLTGGKKYYFRVCSLDSSKSVASSYVSVQTQTLCSAPSIKLASSKSKTATVTITKVSGASKYMIYKSTDNKTWTKAGDTTKLTYELTKLTGGKKIYVKVVAVNAYGKASAYSSVKAVTVKK